MHLIWGALVLPAFMTAQAVAAESAYQPLREADCPRVRSDESGAVSFCHGLDGTPFLVVEGDLRMSVTFGGVGPGSRPPFESFGSFNSLGDVIEWRMEKGRAFASILRWHLDAGDGSEPGQVLVVSKVGTDDSAGCVAAYVDALANTQANELARDAADRIAPNIECEAHVPFYYGVRSTSAGEPMLSGE